MNAERVHQAHDALFTRLDKQRGIVLDSVEVEQALPHAAAQVLGDDFGEVIHRLVSSPHQSLRWLAHRQFGRAVIVR